MSDKKRVIVIVGPTASGKTALGVSLGTALSGEVVSADSMQIYKNMPIASAAPSVEEMCSVPHHLIGFAEPSHSFSVAEYVSLAEKTIDDVFKRGKTPIIVGGTGLYVDSLVSGVKFEEEHNSEVRNELEKQADNLGIEVLFERLKSVDPDTAAKLHLNDRKRIIRALEVLKIHGKTFSEMKRLSKADGPRYDAIWIGITYKDRQKLYDRINRRVDIMLQNGLLDEAKEAYKTSGATAVQAIGHKELFGVFKGVTDLSSAVEQLKMETRRYAKRQMTWFRKNGEINWVYADETEDVLKEALKIIEERTGDKE